MEMSVEHQDGPSEKGPAAEGITSLRGGEQKEEAIGGKGEGLEEKGGRVWTNMT